MAKPRTLLIDADVLRYKLAFANTATYNFGEEDGKDGTVEHTNPEKAKADLEDFVEELCDTLKATSFVLPLSVKSNWRKSIYPAYKANRLHKPKPALWYAVDEYLHELWPDRIITRDRLEGDDILGILATQPKSKWIEGKACIVSIDKDMATIPGFLYNPNKPDLGVRRITQYDADRFWMYQTLTGDTADNYPGCPGIGPKKADAALAGWVASDDPRYLEWAWGRVVEAYESKGFTAGDALLQARLARILRHGDYNFTTGDIRLWEPPKH